MDFGWILLHLASRFGAKCNAFWCILQCVLVQNAVRFGAKCSATNQRKWREIEAGVN